MARTDPQVNVRLPAELIERLAADANANKRSLTAEIVARLEASGNEAPLTATQLADALNCFWNAAIGASHRQQSDIGAATVMAEGFAAVAGRLNEIGGAA